MEILTAMMAVIALAVFLIGAYRKNQIVRYVAILIALISLGATLIDESLASDEFMLLMIYSVALFLMSMAWAMLPEEAGRRRRRNRWPGRRRLATWRRRARFAQSK